MGVYRHLLGDPVSIAIFRNMYKIPANVEVRIDGPDDGFIMDDGWMPFWLVSIVERGGPVPPPPTPQGLSQGVELVPLPIAP